MYSKISLGAFLMCNYVIAPFFIIETAMNKQYTVLPLDGAKCFTHLTKAKTTLKPGHLLKYSLSLSLNRISFS